jgi:hypothetical protein
MLRCVIAAAALVGSGCVIIEASRVGRTPTDKDAEMVAVQLAAKVPASIERHTQIEGWTTAGRESGMSRGGNSTEWTLHFACQTPPESPTGILTPIRADVLAAVEGTGVKVTWASPVELGDGFAPPARFEVRYLRKEGAVAGEVVGVFETSGASRRGLFYVVKVTQREWICK